MWILRPTSPPGCGCRTRSSDPYPNPRSPIAELGHSPSGCFCGAFAKAAWHRSSRCIGVRAITVLTTKLIPGVTGSSPQRRALCPWFLLWWCRSGSPENTVASGGVLWWRSLLLRVAIQACCPKADPLPGNHAIPMRRVQGPASALKSCVRRDSQANGVQVPCSAALRPPGRPHIRMHDMHGGLCALNALTDRSMAR